MTRRYWRRPMSRRAHMLLAWALIGVTRGVFYTPIHPGYGDFPAALQGLVSPDHVWIFGCLWLLAGVLGALTLRWSRYERFFWPTLLCMMAGWGGMYIGGWAAGVQANGWLGGALYLLVAYGMWASKGEPDPAAEPLWICRSKRAPKERPDQVKETPGGSA